MDELLSLKWNNHCSTFLQVLCNSRNKQKYADVTLACAGKFYSAHRIVLSSCSDYFNEIFDTADCKNLVILLKDIKSGELEALLDYMYIGEVNVKQTELSSLIKVAECLQIKGLAVVDEEFSERSSQSFKKNISSPKSNRKRKLDCHYSSYNSPPAKIKTNPVPNKNIERTFEEKSNYQDDVKNIVIKEEEVSSYQRDVFSVDDDDYLKETIASKRNTENMTSAPLNCPSELNSLEIDNNLTMDNKTYSADDSYPGSSYNDNSNPWQGDGSDVGSPPLNYGHVNPSDESSTINQRSDFQCSTCSKKFPGRVHLEIHMRVHTGEKPYACRFCQYKARQKGNLKKHTLTRHGAFLDNT